MDYKLPRIAFLLGLSGFLPQLLAAAVSLHPPHTAFGQFAAFLYGALILSFLGGLWWGVAAANPNASRWIYGVAVLPSLVAFAAGLLWIIHTGSPGQSLLIVGLALLAAPFVDWQLDRRGMVPKGWLAMRVILSTGLGVLTLLLAMKA
jgi:Protein of unknown function (DUF3429)